MPVPIICLDEEMRQFAERFQKLFSRPQYQHARHRAAGVDADVEGSRTLSGLWHQIADGPSLAAVSRFLSEAPWEEAAVAEGWLRHFREEMEPKVAAELERARQRQPKRRGRPKAPVVTGYLIGDDEGVAQAQSQEDGRIGQASFDDRGEAGAGS